ncbi:MAG: circularly permuted type 2 ATP-grasp protein [Cyclobacteriaceae bacterium]|nr:circularly permuted type 2 ATP-grasp protein [Cyclobacteriaceae bacterium]
MNFTHYPAEDVFDEMMDGQHHVRPSYAGFLEDIKKLSYKKLNQLQIATDRAQRLLGMTFNVYGQEEGVERILKLDIFPRIIGREDWAFIEKGLQQRIYALNIFIDDIYHDQKILKDKVLPAEMIYSSPSYLKECMDLKPPKNVWCHITGTDIVRNIDGNFYVLEDNLRCPSGVSYLLENREILKRTFPELFNKLGVRMVFDYPMKLRDMLEYISPKPNPVIAVLTPGIYNSAYFEHSYLALQMGVELVEGHDLIVEKNHLFMRTTRGLQQVDVLYRRIDDIFLDPLCFNPDSMLGIPGIMDVYKKGNLGLANAPGTGVADDKAIYAYVPEIIKYYLGEVPILNNVPTYICEDKNDLKYVIENIDQLVVKETNSAGGYGMLIGPKSTRKLIEEFKVKIKNNPRNYIAQPTLSLSTVPSIVEEGIAPRHVDLRPYILYGENVEVIPGALSRVALKKGSLVVNSSQGGGSKDTWVLE